MEQVTTLHKTFHTTSRNDPCPCRSGRKYKRCHGATGAAPAKVTGPILPSHPLWATFIVMLKSHLIAPEPRDSDGRKIGLFVGPQNPGSETMLLRTFYCLKSLGLSDEDLINNLGVFEQYGGFSDEEILHNVERFFYKTIDPARRKIIFYSQLTGLGDSVIVTGIIREIKRVCPSALIDARTFHENLFLYNPHVEKLDVMAADVELCILSFNHKRLSTADMLLARFKNRIHYAFLMHLLAQSKLGLSWDCKNIKPDLHLGNTLNPVRSELEFSGPYWLINSGFQNSAPEKWYPHYQKVVDLLRGKVQFIQHGGPKDTHGRLNGVLSIAGQTSPLELAAAFRDCAGSLGGPGSHLHFAAAFDRPCVVISGGQEHPESINYENQQTLFKDIGCEKVLSGNLRGCGHRGKYGKSCCPHFLGDHAACMDAIAPEEVADAILKYQRGNL